MSENLSKWLAKELDNRGWSHRELARRAKVSQTSVSQAISQGRGIGWDFCAAIAKPLGESPETIFRLAGLLPPLPASDNGTIISEIVDTVKHLSEEEKRDVLSYLKWYSNRQREKKKPPKTLEEKPRPAPIVQRIQAPIAGVEPELAEKVRAAVEQLTPGERAAWIEYLLYRRYRALGSQSHEAEDEIEASQADPEARTRADQE